MSNVIDDFKLLTDQSMAASFNSIPVDIRSQHQAGFSYQITDGSLLNGTLVVQVSNDKNTWVNYGAYTVAISANANGIFSVYPVPFAYVRLSYTRVAGSGTFNAQFCSKGA